METRLQSSEVRIPKVETSSSGGGGVGFEFSTLAPCPYFQSSFARSLSFNTNQSQSLDFELSFRIGGSKGGCGNGMLDTSDSNGSNNNDDDDEDDGVPATPPPLPATAPPSLLLLSKGPQSLQLQKQQHHDGHGSTPKRRFNTNNLSRSHQDSKYNTITTDIEVLRLRKECQSLIEDNRRLMSLGRNSSDSLGFGAAKTVETVVLQTQVDSLQWQLKQVEASRQMYHAVMEEVVRFLERCHQSLNVMQMNQISRSKSVSHVYGQQDSHLDTTTSTKSRQRTVSTLLDKPQSMMTMMSLDENMDANGPTTDSFSQFKDFTWRRSPKRAEQLCKDHLKPDPVKLSQEAFRLLRTAQSLLSIKDPILSESKSSLCPTSDTTTTTTTTIDHKENGTSRCTTTPKAHLISSTMQRKLNSRESRLSIQSSTDDSVHSTSSSRHETDEDTPAPPHSTAFCLMPSSSVASAVAVVQRVKSVASSVDDESGFSSMNSFQEIGLPVSSIVPLPRTRLSTTSTDISSLDQSRSSANDTDEDVSIRNSNANNIANTATAATIRMRQSPSRTLPICHRRWSSAPPVPPKRNLSTFGGDEPLKVLWV